MEQVSEFLMRVPVEAWCATAFLVLVNLLYKLTDHPDVSVGWRRGVQTFLALLSIVRSKGGGAMPKLPLTIEKKGDASNGPPTSGVITALLCILSLGLCSCGATWEKVMVGAHVATGIGSAGIVIACEFFEPETEEREKCEVAKKVAQAAGRVVTVVDEATAKTCAVPASQPASQPAPK